MTARPVENPANTPKLTPTNTPSENNTLLKNFKATLETRWADFDKATMKEAQRKVAGHIFGGLTDVRSERDKDTDFIKARAAFDTAKAMLEPIQNDAQLKSDTKVLPTVEAALKSITDYLKEVKPEEQGKEINIILAKTTADLSEFKANITGKIEDRKNAEIAIAAERAIPRTAVVATVAGTAGILSSANAAELVNEGTKEVKRGIQSTIAEFFGFDKKTMIEDMAKRVKGESIGFMGTIRVMIFSLLNRFEFLGMTDGWTQEELVKAGIASPTSSNKPEEVKPAIDTQSVIDDISMKAGYKGFVRMYYNSIDGIDKSVKPTDIDSAFQYTPFLNMKYSEAQSLFEKYKSNHKGMSTESQFKGITNIEGAFAALALLVSGGSSTFLKNRFGNSLNNISIRVVFIGIKDSFDIAEGIEDIEIGAFEDVTGFMGKIGEKMDISIKDGKISQEGMRAKAEKLGLGNPKLIAFTLFQAANQPIADFQTNESIDKLDPLDLEGKKKLREILAFGKSIMPVLIKNCSFGEPQKYAEEFNKINPTLSDITKMYITLGGNTDFSTMSQAQHLYCYQRTWHLLGNTKFRGEHFDQPMIQALINDSQNILPPEMKDTFKRLMSRAFTKFMDKMSGIAGEIYGAMKWYHIASVGTVIGAYFLWGKKLAWIGQGAAIASLAMIVSNVLASVSSVGSDGKYTLPSGAKITKEEGAEALINEASRIGVK